MQHLPKTFAITRTEGGRWEPFIPHASIPHPSGVTVHSVMFDDGTIWDAVNGFRPGPHSTSPDRLTSLWKQTEATL